MNLCLQDAGRQFPFIRNALDTVREIAKLIKFSPKWSHLFSEKLAQPESTRVSIKPLCPTRWTARTGAIEAILKDYSLLMETLEEINHNTKDEYGLKAGVLLASLEKFQTLFGFRLGHLVFGASETLSKTLQGKNTSLQEALSAVNLAKSFCQQHRTQKHFDQLFSQTVETAKNLKIGLPQLPRYRKAPARFDGGSQQHQYNSTVDYFRHQYIQIFDLLIRELENRFD